MYSLPYTRACAERERERERERAADANTNAMQTHKPHTISWSDTWISERSHRRLDAHENGIDANVATATV